MVKASPRSHGLRVHGHSRVRNRLDHQARIFQFDGHPSGRLAVKIGSDIRKLILGDEWARWAYVWSNTLHPPSTAPSIS